MEKKFNSLKLALTVTKEFIKALGKSHTYHIRKNPYFIFGILWGIPVPIVTLGMGLSYRSAELSIANAAGELMASPIHFFFLIHPILFGVIFGAMGTIRDDKEKQRLEFEYNLIKANQELKTKNKRLEEVDELKDVDPGDVAWKDVAKINPLDAKRLGIKEGNRIKLSSPTGEITCVARLWEGARPGTLAKCYGQGHWAYGRIASKKFGRVPRGGNNNVIIPPDYDRLSGSTAFYSLTRVKITKT
jgi:hypothetical protein